jgi:hypothetical protein
MKAKELYGPSILFLLLAFLLLSGTGFCHRDVWPGRRAIMLKQREQFDQIRVELDILCIARGERPPSGAIDDRGKLYCGAMKLAEALVGQDGLGFHRNSVFRANGMDQNGVVNLYPPKPDPKNLAMRAHARLDWRASIRKLRDVFGTQDTKPFPPDTLIVRDLYPHHMPILYYKAKSAHMAKDVNDLRVLFDPNDNIALLALGVPWDTATKHPMFTEPEMLHQILWENELRREGMKRTDANSVVFLSAGPDGLYGTSDDVCRFR